MAGCLYHVATSPAGIHSVLHLPNGSLFSTGHLLRAIWGQLSMAFVICFLTAFSCATAAATTAVVLNAVALERGPLKLVWWVCLAVRGCLTMGPEAAR